jgi:hypothetical protein
MRGFRLPDLIWLEPIAKEYGEWEAMIHTIYKARVAMVEPEHAIVCMHDDAHGLCLSGCSDRKGVKKFLHMLEDVKLRCNDDRVTFHGHWKPGTWQARFALKMGLQYENEMYVFHPTIRTNEYVHGR